MAFFTGAVHVHEPVALGRQGEDEPEKATKYLIDSLGIRRANRERLGVVESVEALVSTCSKIMAGDLAVQLISMAAAERKKMNAPVSPLELKRHKLILGDYESALGAMNFSKQWEKGSRPKPDELLDRILLDFSASV